MLRLQSIAMAALPLIAAAGTGAITRGALLICRARPDGITDTTMTKARIRNGSFQTGRYPARSRILSVAARLRPDVQALIMQASRMALMFFA
jgi:hypothetical protein